MLKRNDFTKKLMDSAKNINFWFPMFCVEITQVWKIKYLLLGVFPVGYSSDIIIHSWAENSTIGSTLLDSTDQCACWASAIGRDGMLSHQKYVSCSGFPGLFWNTLKSWKSRVFFGWVKPSYLKTPQSDLRYWTAQISVLVGLAL